MTFCGGLGSDGNPRGGRSAGEVAVPLKVSAGYGRRDLHVRCKGDLRGISDECYALLGARLWASGVGEGRILEEGARLGHVGRVIRRICRRWARKSW